MRAASGPSELPAEILPAAPASASVGGAISLGDRRAWWIVLGLLALYFAGFAAFYPRVLTVNDEMYYVRQATAFSEGGRDLVRPGSEMPLEHGRFMSEYPVGTAVLALPSVLAFGWRGAFVVAPLALALAVLLTARWIALSGGSPLYAAVVLGFPPALVLGRIVMSDLPSTASVALALLLFWRAQDERHAGQRVRWWLAAGLAASLSVYFRESNVLLPLPFFAGALLRRDRGWWALLVGGIAGAATRPLVLWLLYDDPLFVKAAQPFLVSSAVANLLPYLLGLTVLVPGGLLAAALYRGPRRPELCIGVFGYVAFFLVYSYNARESGGLRQLVLSLRFFLPLVPVLAFALAEVVPRLARRLERRLAEARRPTSRRLARIAVGAWVVVLALACVAVHPASARWASSREAVVSAIYSRTPAGSVLLSSTVATGKYVNELYGPRLLRDWQHVRPAEVPALARRREGAYLVFLDRDESDFWRLTRQGWMAWRAEVLRRCRTRVLHDAPTGLPGEHLRIERLTRCRSDIL